MFFFNFLGIVRGNSEVEIKVTFAPMDFSTAHMKLQVRLLIVDSHCIHLAGQGSKSHTSLNYFSGLILFATAKVAYTVYNCNDHPSFNSSSRSSYT